jgi:cobalt-zinc-cadmium efflux system outer membrane protein
LQTLASAIGSDHLFHLSLATRLDQLPVLPPRDQILSSTLQANSRISLARIAITKARQSHKLAKANAVPNLVASVGPRYSDIDNETTIDVGIGIEIPLFDRNQGEISATLAERLSASANLKSTQLELIAEVSRTWATYQTARSAANRYRTQLIPKAQRTLDLTRQAYQSGKSDYLRMLDAQQIVIESEISYINTLEQLHYAASLLNELSQSNTPWRNPQSLDKPRPEMNE